MQMPWFWIGPNLFWVVPKKYDAHHFRRVLLMCVPRCKTLVALAMMMRPFLVLDRNPGGRLEMTVYHVQLEKTA